jgi:prophage maintenance system killer protein
MLTFLVLNGVEPAVSPEQLFEWTMLAAVGKLDRPGLARLLKQHSRKRR